MSALNCNRSPLDDGSRNSQTETWFSVLLPLRTPDDFNRDTPRKTLKNSSDVGEELLQEVLTFCC